MNTVVNKTLLNNKKISGIKSEYVKDAIQAYIMILLPIIGFFVFTLYPMLWSVKWAWFTYDMVPSHTKFVGWQNFITIFTHDLNYWKAWGNTFLFAVLKMPIEISLAFFLAVLLNGKLKGKGFFRSMFFMPNIISLAIIGLIFSNIFGYFGVANGLLQKWHIINEGVDWFSQKSTAMAIVVFASIWNTFGVNILYFLAALQNIPNELYESASLDGASKPTVMFKITLPMIAPVLQTILMLSIMGTLSTCDIILVMTNGGPGGQTNVVATYIINNFVPGFAASGANIGYGCAISIITSFVMGGITLIYMMFSKKLSTIY
jgi:raffinose/stachyose/melibiose transport system permease protein